mgnify:CR=1 FL=1
MHFPIALHSTKSSNDSGEVLTIPTNRPVGIYRIDFGEATPFTRRFVFHETRTALLLVLAPLPDLFQNNMGALDYPKFLGFIPSKG